ncbi:MAG: hypothetical protein IT349_14110 [Candidatus Eisenbacteria bacterium]|nr:hypothetical protein [Candidatus Eisenbacteria bacterium]
MRTARHRSPATVVLSAAFTTVAAVVALAAIIHTIAVKPCHAGPNAYGTLILHQNPALQGSCAGAINGLSGIERCTDAVTRVDDPTRCAVVYVLAAFPGWAAPSLTSVSFGFEYDQAEFTLGNLSSTADLEFSSDGWPAPGSGTSVVWTVPLERHLAEIYAFSAMFYGDGPARVALSAHPTGAALFGDGNGLTDPITSLGALGWNEPGFLPCPREVGACCWVEGECLVTNPFECESSGGHFIGEGIQCAPDVCSIATGACCFPNGNCEILPRTTCEEQDGVFQGMDVPCTSYPCFDLSGCGPAAASRPLREGVQNTAGEIGRWVVGRRHDDQQGDPPCGELLLHTDGTFENGYTWQYGGVGAPYFGAFAECFEGSYLICNAVLELTGTGFGESTYTDLHI